MITNRSPSLPAARPILRKTPAPRPRVPAAIGRAGIDTTTMLSATFDVEELPLVAPRRLKPRGCQHRPASIRVVQDGRSREPSADLSAVHAKTRVGCACKDTGSRSRGDTSSRRQRALSSRHLPKLNANDGKRVRCSVPRASLNAPPGTAGAGGIRMAMAKQQRRRTGRGGAVRGGRRVV